MTYIAQTLAHLAQADYTRPNPRLLDLSNLDSAEEKLFEQTWAGIKTEVRRQIIRQLVELAEDNVELNFDSIFRHCLQDSDTEVRRKAIEGLWECEDVTLISPLIELMERDSSTEVRAAAATSLGNFALLAEWRKIRSRYASRIAEALLSVVGDPAKPVEIRCRALESVAPLSLPEVTEAIKGAYYQGDAEFKSSAICAMGRNCDTAWLPILIAELSSADVTMRYEAAQACGELGEGEAVPYLAELVDDPATEVALTAIQALGRIGGGEAKKRLQQLLEEAEEIVRQAAREALAESEAEEEPFPFHSGNP